MGIFSRLFKSRREDESDDGELEELDGDVLLDDEALHSEHDEDSEVHTIAVHAATDDSGDRPSQESGRKSLQLDPLDPADFEVRTKSGRKRLLSVGAESDPPPEPPVEPSEPSEPSEPFEPSVTSSAEVPKLTPLAIDVERLLESEPPKISEAKRAEDDLDLDFDAELERGFAESLRRSSRPAPPMPAGADSVTTESDLAQVRDLFHDMAAHYVGQVRDFMLELRRADAAAIWIPLCEPVVQRLLSMCQTLTMPEVSSALEEFGGALTRAKSAAGGVVQGAERDALLASYDRLIELLPRAFDVNDTGREAIIVELLLLQIPAVRHLTLEKLYRAGVHQFDAFMTADPQELAEVSGIEVSVAEEIVRRFREYRQSVTGVLAEPEPDVERSRLVPLVVLLREQQDGYEKASARWSKDAIADKRRLRPARLKTLSEVYVVLARLGEVERVARLKKMGVEWQLKDIIAYLREFNTELPPG